MHVYYMTLKIFNVLSLIVYNYGLLCKFKDLFKEATGI